MMAVLRDCCVLVLLAALGSAGPITPNAGCTYRGRVYDNLDTIPHDNGCATLQCQFGRVVTFYEACGKDVDGKCHRINMMYVYKGSTYECRKVPVGSSYEYQNVVAIAANEDCVEGRQTYKHLDKFVRPGGCQQYQCQSGVTVALNEGCEQTIDGKCHLVGELYAQGSKTYTCTTQDRNGETLFVNTPLATRRNTRPCTKDGETYTDLQVFRLPGRCQVFQCQDRAIKILAQECTFKADNNKCYAVGEGWKFQNNTYQCDLDDNGRPRPVEVSKGFKQCKRSERWYNHLEIQTRSDGCVQVQCQDGVTPPVEEACAMDSGECMQLNQIWRQGGKTLICILKGPGLYRIEEVDDFGNIIEREVVTLPPPVFEETCPNLKGDIVFVWDASGSMSRANFARQLHFSCDIASAFKIGPDNVQFGGVVFSTSAEKVFDLNTSHDIKEVCQNIQSTPYIGSQTETQKAFDVILEEGMFLPDAGGRPDAPKIVIVITDGVSTNTTITVAAAGQIKALGVQIISIGVGKVDMAELNGIASRPENVFTIDNYGAIFSLRKQVAERACDVPTDPPVTPDETIPPKCPNAVADILFILDSSSGVGSENYQTKLDLATNITSMFTVSPRAVQFGSVLVSTQPKTAFNLNTHSSNGAVARAISGAEYLRGERELDDAIDSVLSQGLYTTAKGGRDRAARVAVILIDGPPTDWATTLPLAKRLRNEGVRVITVGIGNIQMKRLTGLSGNTQYVFASPNYHLLGFTKALLYQRLCEASKLPRPEIEPPRCTDTETPPCDQFCSNTDSGFTCYCKTGYLVNKQNNSKCDDKDECTNTKLCQQICQNTVGSYTCRCQEGFTVSPDDPSDCVDIDECLSNPCQAACTNTEGSYTCTCNEGYRVSPTDAAVCTDIDECKESSPCQQLCTNTDGGYTCACRPGYAVNPTDPTKCDDIDECRGSSPCQQLCTNTDGSYTCSCRPGYVVSPTDPNKCDDIDECSGSSPCQQLCTNTDGSYTCSCRPGYVVSPTDPNKCDDIDECSGSSPCQQLCTNTDGSYTCSCRPGYVVSPTDPNKCDDIDECIGASPCQQLCTNTDGSYTCSCRPGYVVSPTDPNKCDDINECSGSSPCQQLCTNTGGSYTCSCNPGYVVSPTDPNKCDDVNECTESSPCQHICVNTVGSYTCSCNPGFVVSSTDPTRCDDVNECRESSPCQQMCTNTVGSFTCSCQPGFVVRPTDPTRCDDIDECEAGQPCQQICTNTEGSYTCSCRQHYGVNPVDPSKCDSLDHCKIKNPCQQVCDNDKDTYKCSCTSGYVVSPTDPTKCDDINECPSEPCEQVCKNTIGSYSCSCVEGYTTNKDDPSLCTDIDECKTSQPCEQTCTNTQGSYQCSCRPGFGVSSVDSSKCDPLDHCKEKPCDQICENKGDTYKCSCRPGFVISSTLPNVCEDINECPSEPCEQVCTNTIGSYSCSCVEGYMINKNDPSLCTEIDKCKKEPCEQICKNTPCGFNCSCFPGYVVNPSDITTCIDEDECQDRENPPCHHTCINTQGSYRCDCRKGYVPNDCDKNTCRDIDECEQGLCESTCTNTRGGYFCS